MGYSKFLAHEELVDCCSCQRATPSTGPSGNKNSAIPTPLMAATMLTVTCGVRGLHCEQGQQITNVSLAVLLAALIISYTYLLPVRRSETNDVPPPFLSLTNISRCSPTFEFYTSLVMRTFRMHHQTELRPLSGQPRCFPSMTLDDCGNLICASELPATSHCRRRPGWRTRGTTIKRVSILACIQNIRARFDVVLDRGAFPTQ